MRVMRNTKWIVTAGLLLSLSAAAQQPAESQPPSDPATQNSAAPMSSTPSSPASVTRMPAPPKAEAQPSTMDQVVDRFISREKGLVKMLETRTPVVETGLHTELIRRDGPYRQLMGAQAEERGDDFDTIPELAAVRTAGNDEGT